MYAHSHTLFFLRVHDKIKHFMVARNPDGLFLCLELIM